VDEALLTELHEMLGGDYTRHWLIVDNSDGSPEDAAAAIARSLGLAIRAESETRSLTQPP